MVGHHNKEQYALYFDMIPYSDDGLIFNTGLFTSRPNLKSAVRYGSQILHAANKLYVAKTAGQLAHKEEAEGYLRVSQMLTEVLASA